VKGLVLLVLVLVVACSHVNAAERNAIKAYADGIHPAAVDGGRIVQDGIKPGLRDLENGSKAPADFRSSAAAWRRDMEDVRRRFAAVAAPPGLALAKSLFDQSLGDYLRAIDAFVAASLQPKSKLQAAITAAVPIAEKADKTYDRASTALKAEMQRVGLPVPSNP
jgi:hypothetical protein